jgi:hypothetical protein
MADTESPETDARTTGHAWTEGECVNCRAVSPRPWAEPCAESPRADVELTEVDVAAHRDSYPMGNNRHGTPERPDWGTFCVECKQSWPCDVSILAAERDDLRALRLAVEATVMRAASDHQRKIRDGSCWCGNWPDDDETTWMEHLSAEVMAVLDGPARLRDPAPVRLRAVLASPSTHTQRDTEHAPEPVTGHVIQRIVNAWDCCGTCAGGVLAQWLAQRDTETAAQALREAADEVAAIERFGRSTSDDLTDDERERWMSSPLNRLWAVDGVRPRPIVEQWLRARADSLATGEEQP